MTTTGSADTNMDSGVGRDAAMTAMHATYQPHELKYHGDFEDSLINAILFSDDTTPSGIRVIPHDSDEMPVVNESVRLSDIDFRSLPTISKDELPLTLDDPRRIFASPIPGVKLTHPAGYLEGGPGPDPERDRVADDADFLSLPRAGGGPSATQQALQREVAAATEALRERLRARQKARERNEQIEKELRTLTEQHHMELRIHNRMQVEVAKKKEAREKRRKEKEGG